MLATLGRTAAVGTVFGVRLTGFPAWLAWLFIHLFFLIEFENRLLVLVQWAWNYVTFSRPARLITDPALAPVRSPPVRRS
jgi:NADH dehydrogenase